MYDACSLTSIIEKLDDQVAHIRPSSDDKKIGFLLRGGDLHASAGSAANAAPNGNPKLIGILFAHASSELAKSEINEQLNYYYHRTGESIDIFCSGYGAYRPPEHYPKREKVGCVDGVDWYFSDIAFDRMRKEIESKTAWQYSGETDLILINAQIGQSGGYRLDWSCAIACNIEELIRVKAFSSCRALIERICQFAESYRGKSPVWVFSDKQGLAKAKEAFLDAILLLVPRPVRDKYKGLKQLAVRDISKESE